MARVPKDTLNTLQISIGQASSAGVKPVNQDFHGALVPTGQALALKGAVLAVADGISTSEHSHIAAETAVKALMTDYYATPDAWTVKTSASRVIAATNSWLHAQSGHAGISDADRGHVCTLAALIVKARTAHLFHVGDSRIWRVSGRSLEPLTRDHRASLGGGETVLSRAMGVSHTIEIDHQVLPLSEGDVFLLTTDGVHEHWQPQQVTEVIAVSADLNTAAAQIVETALAAGSPDNLTLQILRIDALPPKAEQFDAGMSALPVPNLPRDGDVLDGFTILRQLHGNHRSHIFLAKQPDGTMVALKIPSTDMRDDKDALRRFVMEEWIARRLSNPHLMGAPDSAAERSGLYVVTDYVQGQSLRQWMQDNPKPSFEQVRDIIEQVIQGLRALHRREMLHQDLRPENIMITPDGVVKLIDYGSTYVSGVQEAAPALDDGILGTLQYTAPEYFSGESVGWRSELFSLGVITYEMLTGALPYGTQVGKIRTPRDRTRLRYRNARDDTHPIPDWLDEALQRAVHPDPMRRHDALSEFAANLRAPGASWRARHRKPLAERDPVRFWKTVSGLLAILCVILAVFGLQ